MSADSSRRGLVAVWVIGALGVIAGQAGARWTSARASGEVVSAREQTRAPSFDTPTPGEVRTGIDVLVEEDFARLRGRRVAILTSAVGRDRLGRRTIDLVARADGVELVRLFSPEHGLEASREGTIEDAVDATTGLAIHSLYGASRRPSPEELAGFDTLVVDLQDVGVRFYTYQATMGLAMEACGEAGVRVLVLDRPNPIAPLGVDGPLQDEDRHSFIAWQPLPVVHGLTIGELARYFVHECGIECELEVVALRGWSRSMWYEDTGLPWIDPSPNLRNPTACVLYPAIGLLEACNLSVGRGTDQPFERLGAPWIDPLRLAARLRALDLPGLSFTPLRFTPDASRFAGEVCGGVHLTLDSRVDFEGVELGLAIAWALEVEFPEAFDDARLVERWGHAATSAALFEREDPRGIAHTWSEGARAFEQRTRDLRLYR